MLRNILENFPHRFYLYDSELTVLLQYLLVRRSEMFKLLVIIITAFKVWI